METKYKLIALAPNRWDGPWMNRQQLLSRLGRTRPVLYSNGLWDSWDIKSEDWRRSPVVGTFVIDSNVRVRVNGRCDIRWRKWPHLDHFLLQRAARRWRQEMSRHEGALVAHVFHPAFGDYIGPIGADVLVYHAYDLFSSTPGWNAELNRKEKELLARADAVVASSDAIADQLEIVSGRPVKRIFNGVDFSSFASVENRPPPADVASIARPRVSYVGRINRKVDLPLVLRLSRRRPEWSFVMVGPVSDLDEETRRAHESLLGERNVHFLGAKQLSELPGYMAASDVNLMCYRLENGWAQFGYPLKMHEYLASGKPVVSSGIEVVRRFSDVVGIATPDARQWDEAILRALSEDNDSARQKRREVAASNDWEQRAAELDRLIGETIQCRLGAVDSSTG